MPHVLPSFQPELLAFDLDGTLLAHGSHVVSVATKHALKDLKAKGVRIAVITGRSRLRRTLLDSLELDAVATGNGAELTFSDGASHTELLAESDVEVLLGHGLHGAHVLIYGTGGYAVDTSCVDVSPEWMTAMNCPPIGPDQRKTALKVIYKHAEASAWADHLRVHYPHLSVTGGMEPYLHEVNVTSRAANKGTALQRMMGYLGVSPSRVMAFGDTDNDAPLLKQAAFGVQVGTHAHLEGLAQTRLTRQEDLEAYLLDLATMITEKCARSKS